MAIRTTDEFPIKVKFFYIINFSNLMRPKLMPIYYPTRNTAKRVLRENVKSHEKRKKYTIYSGYKIRDENLEYVIGSGSKFINGGKYPYPHKKMTPQERKSFRTLLRRRLRRMDLLTNNQAKFRYDEKTIKRIKHKPNHQIVAKSPATDAKCFWLERGSRHTWYIVLSKRRSFKVGKLFRIRAIRIGLKTGKWKKVTIYLRTTDIIHAELLRNLYTHVKASAGLEAYTKYCKRKQEKAL